MAEANRKGRGIKICVVMMGRQAPGGQNVVDGLLRYNKQRGSSNELCGAMDGISGLLSNNIVKITEEDYAPYRNLGGYDFLGNGTE